MIYPTLSIESQLWNKGYSSICGIDEVGRGCFAGPVVVGGVIFPKGVILPEGVADSKVLTPQKRRVLSKQIINIAKAWAVAEIGVNVINDIGIGKATQVAFRKVLKLLSVPADFVLIDAFYIQHLSRKRQLAVKDGDSICASIAAASIVAKVYRDELMEKLHLKFPKYGFDKHKGYGTKAHQEAIRQHGLSKIHRTSFDLSKFLSPAL